MLPPKRSTRAIARRAAPPLPRLRRLPRVNDIVEIRWEDRDKYFRGTLARSIEKKPHSFFVRYHDGDCYNVNLNEFQWRYNQETAATQEKEDYTEAFEFMPGDLEKLSEQDGNFFGFDLSNASSPASKATPGADQQSQGSSRILQVELHSTESENNNHRLTGNHKHETSRTPFHRALTFGSGSQPGVQRHVGEIIQKRRMKSFYSAYGSVSGSARDTNTLQHNWKKRMLQEFLSGTRRSFA